MDELPETRRQAEADEILEQSCEPRIEELAGSRNEYGILTEEEATEAECYCG